MILRALFLLLALLSGMARADTPLTLFKTWAGNVNFTGTVASMRNSTVNTCSVYGSNTTLSMALAGIPTTATILSAQLYWAGSGSTRDYTVGFESGNVTSTAARSYTSASVGSGLDYFSGAVDVTAQVIARKNGNYQFFNLAVNTGNPWCSSSAVLSGFSLLVVYSDASQPYRVLNLYEGFQYYRSNSVSTTMTGFRVPQSLTSSITGRIGHITWEGDPASSTGEDITYNGTKMVDTLNPSGNQFNSKSGISNNSTSSIGVDFDDYDVAAPVIASGQTSATSVYSTGTDMVLLSALIIAAPSDNLVDLSVAMTRNGAFQTGTAGSYTLSVYNAGPATEVGPITLVDTLPAGVTFVSATGTRWSCSAAGQVVTCKYNGLFTINTYLPDITLTVLPGSEGSMTNTASVSGVGYDTATANNSASDTTTVTRGVTTYAFTDIACKPNIAVGTAGQCNYLTADSRIPAATSADGYLTVLSGGMPVARSTTAATTVQVYFALTCVMPVKHAGVRATINTVALPLCADGPNAPAATSTAWSTGITLSFAANAPSAKITFYYADVGRLQLSVREATGSITSSPTIVSRPVTLRMAIPGNPSTVSSTTAPFMPAGQPFPITIDALMSNNATAPNFGNGDATLKLAVSKPPATGSADEQAMSAAMGAFPPFVANGLDKPAAGVFNVTGTFSEVGVLVFNLTINGFYFGVDDVGTVTMNVGRFYPSSFKTSITPVFAKCADTGAACPASGVPGAAYATQAFDVAVTPLDVNNNEVRNFRGVFGDPIDLSAVDSAGGSTVNPPAAPTGAKLTSAQIPALAATGTNASLRTGVSYALPVPFLRTLPAATAWTLPTPIFLRASAVDTPNVLTVTSKQNITSLEDGIMILNGRVQLGTVLGSELLRLPVTMQAQFWNKTGTAAALWFTNPADNGATPTAIAFSSCKRNLLVAGACYGGLQMSPKDATFTGGKARFFINAPGAGKTGSAMFNMTGAPAWLPSTLSQATFGVYKSHFLYLREVY